MLSLISFLTVCATLVASAPFAKRDLSDVDILQFALTLEHLENVFYKSGVSSITEQEFLDAGFSASYYNNLLYVVHNEEAHVQLLTSSLMEKGVSPVQACEYEFGFTDPKSFITLASVLEGVGSAAYLGAASMISSSEYLHVAGSILVTEALHTAIHRSALGNVVAGSPYGSALDPNQIFTLAASFIKSCPSSNYYVPLSTFPSLNATQGVPAAPGSTFTFSSEVMPTDTFYVTFVNGLIVESMDASISDGMIQTTIPSSIGGQSYAFITNSNVTSSSISDSTIISGPAILEVTPPSPTFDVSLQ